MLFEAIMDENQKQVFTIHIPIKSDITQVESIAEEATNRNNEVMNCKHFFGQNHDSWNVFLVIPLILVVIVTNIDLAIIPKSYVIPFIEIDCQILFNELNSIFLVFAGYYFDYTLIMGKSDAISKKNFVYLILNSTTAKFLVYGGLSILKAFEIDSISQRMGDLIATIIMQTALYTINWFQHSKSMRLNSQFRRRYGWFIIFKLALVLMNTCFRQASVLFDLIKNMFQPALVFVFIGLKEGITKLLDAAVKRARGENESSARFDVMCNVDCRYALYLMLIVGYKATMATTITYIVVDSVSVFRLLYKTVKFVGIQGNQNRIKVRDSLEEVTLQESLVILLPLCFCSIFVMSFYGPNKETSALVQNETQDTMISTLGKIGMFMLFDLARIVVFSLLLQLKYKISYFKSFTEMMKSYWKVIGVFAAGSIFSVSIKISS